VDGPEIVSGEWSYVAGVTVPFTDDGQLARCETTSEYSEKAICLSIISTQRHEVEQGDEVIWHIRRSGADTLDIKSVLDVQTKPLANCSKTEPVCRYATGIEYVESGL